MAQKLLEDYARASFAHGEGGLELQVVVTYRELAILRDQLSTVLQRLQVSATFM
jgi:hypothetical protein